MGAKNSIHLFGKYLLLKKVASGGMAEVFLARPAAKEANGRVVVIKRILPHVADDPTFLQMFRSEIQVIMSFNHPHTVQLYDFGEVEGQPYISMEFIDGKNLKEVMNKFIEKNEKIPVPMSLGLLIQAASGLNYAHTFENKVTGEIMHAVHRDITPHNLILSYDGNLKVIDFGISKARSEMAEKTRTGLIKGKIRYLSPEQVFGQPADERSDLFSLGVVAWELLTLKRPFNAPGDEDHNILDRIKDCAKYLIPPSQLNPEVPQEVDQIILRSVESDPNLRFQSARDFQRALREILLRSFPSYSYSDTAQIMQALFEQEMKDERRELQAINERAQSLLTDELPMNAPVEIIKEFSELKRAEDEFSFPVGGQPVSATDFSLIYDIKLEKLKKKASKRIHLLFVGVYILAVLSMKLDQKYDLFDHLFGKKTSKSQK